MTDANSPPRRKRIAVVAVHGVADQAPFDSARAAGNLLLNLNRSAGHTRYTPFVERAVRIAVRPVVTPPRDGQPPKGAFSAFDQRGPAIRQCHQKTAELTKQSHHPAEAPPAVPKPPEHVFMDDQLCDYAGGGPENAYCTIRMEATRLSNDCPEADVHVYEMYWADLSRLGSGVLRLVGELYQLTCHLSHLGRHAIDLAYLQYKTNAWRLYKRAHGWAVGLLTVPIIILHVFVLALGLVPLAGSIPRPDIASLAVLAFLTAGATSWLCFSKTEQKPRQGARLALWGAAPFLVAGVTVLAAIAIGHLGRKTPWFAELGGRQLLALEWTAILAAAVAYVVRQYDRRQRGANVGAAVMGAAVLGVLVPQLALAPDSHAGIGAACLRAIELTFVLLVLAWAGLVMAELAAWVLGSIARRHVPKDERDRARRATWTARLTLSFSICVIFLIGILGGVVLRYLPLPLLDKRAAYTSILVSQGKKFSSGYSFVDQLLEVSATRMFIWFLASLALAGILAAWSLFPVVWAEAVPPRRSDSRLSSSLGTWLSNGFRVLGFAGRIVFWSVTTLLPIGALVSWGNTLWGSSITAGNLSQDLSFIPVFDSNTFTKQFLAGIGALIAAPAVILLLVQSKQVTLGFRAILDIALDVDNHLRVRPLDCTPRAQIAARYASLLRYLCRCTDEDGTTRSEYDAIVIFAHSQGTVITADLLRYVRYNWDQGVIDRSLERVFALRDMKVYFFTMGCPLRQLYGARFPHLYAWARHNDQSAVASDAPLDARREPRPDELGVHKWVNAFRSGDYVGRHLWRSDLCTDAWAHVEDSEPRAWRSYGPMPKPVTVGAGRREFCIGPGAHTHYWDGTAKPIAVELDRLIFEAAHEQPPTW